jgi:pimeloyl-ACP methyl ester carboxylesterase
MIRSMQPESERALLDLTFRWEAPPPRDHTPTLVVAAGADKLFPPARVQETARRYGSRALVLPGLPHMLMLDDGWQSAADAIVDWLERTLEV